MSPESCALVRSAGREVGLRGLDVLIELVFSIVVEFEAAVTVGAVLRGRM